MKKRVVRLANRIQRNLDRKPRRADSIGDKGQLSSAELAALKKQFGGLLSKLDGVDTRDTAPYHSKGDRKDW